jgi:glutathione peroxidase
MRELAVMHEDLMEEGFTVLAFPTNDFHQEFTNNEEISQFWMTEFPEATFPIFALSSLAENPVYNRIGQHLPENHVKHNFFKYLVNREGVAVKMFTKKQNTLSLQEEIQQYLKDTSSQ